MIKNYFRELDKLLIGNEKLNQPNKRCYWKERKENSHEAKRRSKRFKLKKGKVC